MLFEYACDAVVSVKIIAKSKEDADMIWRDFCEGIDRIDEFRSNVLSVPGFKLDLLYTNPHVEMTVHYTWDAASASFKPEAPCDEVFSKAGQA